MAASSLTLIFAAAAAFLRPSSGGGLHLRAVKIAI
jgi:hypothetical protein